jgi:hypothetical protein
MRSAMVTTIMMTAILMGTLPLSGRCAEGKSAALPTLLIKGEVISLDTTDPSAALLKVKDRYGFETPIILTPETTVSRGESPATMSDVQSGATVEVEYNFDINTARRHAVSVTLPAPPAAAEEIAQPAGTTAAPAEAASSVPAPAGSAPTPTQGAAEETSATEGVL